MNTDDRLLQRFEATGKAASRYLYLLLISAAFFLAIDRRLATDPKFAGQILGVPAVELAFEAEVIWMMSPIILGVVLLAVLGTLSAATSAWQRMRERDAFKDEAWEVMDTTPNLIDFAVFATHKTPRLGRTAALLSYPLVLTSASVLCGYLTVRVWQWNLRPSWRWAVVACSAGMLFPIAWRVVRLWRRKLTDIGGVWQGRQAI